MGKRAVVVASVIGMFAAGRLLPAGELEAVPYNHAGLTVDLGVGLWAWPLPMDFDGDGDLDLVVSCPDKPSNGTYFFENVDGNVKFPVFRPGVRIGPGFHNIRVSHMGGAASVAGQAGGVPQTESEPRVLVPGREFRDFRTKRFDAPAALGVASNVHTPGAKIRANQWHYTDHDGDGALDLIVGVGDWTDYGWDDAFNNRGEWTRGPLRGFVYLLRNTGTTDEPQYARPEKINAAGDPLEVFGWPSPNLVDFDADGDLDLLCGEFLDRFTYFENVGSRKNPEYAAGRFLEHDGRPLRMDLQMIVPSAIDWDRDGDMDLIVGDEDGRVALVEHTGHVSDGLPQFLPPRYFTQQADTLKFGALATPVGCDWDGDGDDDILCGNTAGYIGFIENLGGGAQPKWAMPRRLEANGEVIRIQAGPNGSIQGPCEAKWGYTTLSAADWDHDGRLDLVVNSIWGKVVWFRNVGARTAPKLAEAGPIEVAWPGTPPKPTWNWWDPQGNELATQWRTTPVAIDWTGDGLCDLVMLDHEGYLTLFERQRHGDGLRLLPGRRVFIDESGEPLRLNDGYAGKSGRRKLCIVDWDGDGRPDVLANGVNADYFRNVEDRDGRTVLKSLGPLSDRPLAGHTSSPAVVDWDANGIPDLLIGAEDGRLYHMRNPRTR